MIQIWPPTGTQQQEIITLVYIPNLVYRIQFKKTKKWLFNLIFGHVFVHEPGFTTAALLSYKDLDESLNSYFNHLETEQKLTFKINSKVVTVTVSNSETDNLRKPVNLTFSHLEVWNNSLSVYHF